MLNLTEYVNPSYDLLRLSTTLNFFLVEHESGSSVGCFGSQRMIILIFWVDNELRFFRWPISSSLRTSASNLTKKADENHSGMHILAGKQLRGGRD